MSRAFVFALALWYGQFSSVQCSLRVDCPPLWTTDSNFVSFKESNESSDATQTVCRLDGDMWVACDSPVWLHGVSDGHHDWQLKRRGEVYSVAFTVETESSAPYIEISTSPIDEPLTKILSLQCPLTMAKCVIKYAWDDEQSVEGSMAAISAKGTYSFENETLYLQISDSDEATIQTDYFASIHSLGLRVACTTKVSAVTDVMGTITSLVTKSVECEPGGLHLDQPFRADEFQLEVLRRNGSTVTTQNISLHLLHSLAPTYVLRKFKSPGLRLLYAQATDLQGNSTQVVSIANFSVGIPRVVLRTVPPYSSYTARNEFRVFCDTLGLTAQCNLSYSIDYAPDEQLFGNELTLYNVSDGEHFASFTACDAIGCSEKSEWMWSVNTSKPAAILAVTPSLFSQSAQAYFEFTSDKADVHFMCSVDSANEWLECRSPLSFTVSDGNHSLRVLGVDSVGRAMDTPKQFDWQVDTFQTFIINCPDRPIMVPYSLYFTSVESGVECTMCPYVASIDKEPPFNASSPVVIDRIANGSHSLFVAAVDLYSNTYDNVRICNFTSVYWNTSTNATALLDSVTFPSGFILASNVSFSFNLSSGYTLRVLLMQHGRNLYTDFITGWVDKSPSFLLHVDDGMYTLYAKAVSDEFETSPLVFEWHQRTSPPRILLQETPENSTHLPWANFVLNMTYEVQDAVVWMKLDNDSWKTTTYPNVYISDLATENHTVQFAVQLPQADNGRVSCVSYTWEVILGLPETVVLTKVPSITSNTSISLAFDCYLNGTPSLCSYQYQVYNSHTMMFFSVYSQSALWYPTQQHVLFYNLVDGENTIVVRAKDEHTGLTDNTPAKAVIYVDTVMPIATLLSTQINQARDMFTFTFGCNKKGMCTFLAWFNSKALGSISNPFILESPPEVWELQVQPVDTAGNHGNVLDIYSSDMSTIERLAITFLHAPAHMTAASEAYFLVLVQLEQLELISVQIWFDDVLFAERTMAQQYNLEIGGLDEGEHILSLRVLSAGRSLIGFASYDWTVDRSCPLVSFSARPPSLTHMSSAFFTLVAEDSLDDILTCYVSADGGPWGVKQCNSDLELTNLSPGVHTLRLQVIDATGRTSPQAAKHGWVVDFNASRGVPGPAFDVQAAPSTSGAYVQWVEPSDDGGSTITAYTVVAETLYQAIPVYTSTDVAGTATSAFVSGLQNGIYYSFFVLAHNTYGTGDPSASSSAVLPFDTSDPCGSTLCSYAGTCMLSKGAFGLLEPYCVCKPGYAGSDCSTLQERSLYVPIPSSWSACSRPCNSGYRTRVVRCYQYTDGDLAAFYSSPKSTCSADAAAIATKELCHVASCGIPRLSVALELSVAMEDVGFDLESQDGLRQSIFLEVSYALNIDTRRLTNFDVTRGSSTNQVRVEFEVETGQRDTDLSIDVVQRTLEIHFSSQYSILRSTGTWMRRYVAGSAVMEVQYPQLVDPRGYTMALGAIILLAITGTLLLVVSLMVLYANTKEIATNEEDHSFLDTSRKTLYRHGSFRKRIFKILHVLAVPLRVLWRLGVRLWLRAAQRIWPSAGYNRELSSEDMQILDCWPDEKEEDDAKSNADVVPHELHIEMLRMSRAE